MTVGDKIKLYRLRRRMTQKQLGMAMGFPEKNAEARIAQYERNIKSPRPDIIERFAEVLQIDISALSDIDFNNEIDAIRILIDMDAFYGISVERTREKTTLSFNNQSPKTWLLDSLLYTWYIQKKNISTSVPAEYDEWVGRIPMDLTEYWNNQYGRLIELYSPLVADMSKHTEPITRFSEFIRHIRNMISSGIHVTASEYQCNVFRELAIEIPYNELVEATEGVQQESITAFFLDLDSLRAQHIWIDVSFKTDESGTVIRFSIHHKDFAAFWKFINDLQRYESESPHSEFDSHSFEQKYELKLKEYDIIIKAFSNDPTPSANATSAPPINLASFRFFYRYFHYKEE